MGPIGCPEARYEIAATHCVITQNSAALIWRFVDYWKWIYAACPSVRKWEISDAEFGAALFCVSPTVLCCHPAAHVRCVHCTGVVSHLTQEISLFTCDILQFQDWFRIGLEIWRTIFPCTHHEFALATGRIDPFILNLGNRWRWEVSAMTSLVYSRVKPPVRTDQGAA